MELIFILGGLAIAVGVVAYFIVKSRNPPAPIVTPDVMKEVEAIRADVLKRFTQTPPPPEDKK